MSESSRWERIVQQIRRRPGLVETLPAGEASIVRDALAGRDVHEIATRRQMSEETVWEILGNAARLAAGDAPSQRVEVGGLGSDTDPGVTGGYGETGFGSPGLEPPEPIPEEPEEERGEGG